MEFIAAYWWVWLIGVLICASFALFKWLMNIFGLAGTVYKATKLTIEGTQVVRDGEKTTGEKASHIKNRAVEEAFKAGVNRLKGLGFTAAGILFAAIFAILLVLSIVLNIAR